VWQQAVAHDDVKGPIRIRQLEEVANAKRTAAVVKEVLNTLLADLGAS
jgi:hypothetical protein